MSDTTSAPQGDAGDDPAEPAATTTAPQATAPADEGAATDDDDKGAPKPTREDRRIARLTARLAAETRERVRLSDEVARYRQQPAQAGQDSGQDEQRRIETRAEELAAQRDVERRRDAFHEMGGREHRDWSEKCQALMDMGVDAGFSHLLIEMDDGVRVAAALADDPDETERIAGLRTERARAIALGKFAASIGAKAAEAPPAPVASRAPPPIQPVRGTARVAFNEYNATPQQLVEFYAKQAQAKRQGTG